MYRFEAGMAYQFTACVRGGRDDSFLAVATDRSDARIGVEFLVPRDLISGEPWVLDGREFVKVNVGGREYCASAAAPFDVGASFALLDQIRRTPGVRA